MRQGLLFSIIVSIIFYSPLVIADIHPNLIHWWAFDETIAGIAEDSVGTADGILSNGASWMNGSVHLDGDNDYVYLPDGFADSSSGFTISLWVYPTNSPDWWPRFIEFGNGMYADNIIFGRYYDTNSVVFQCYNGASTAGSVIAENAVQLDTWQLFTVSLDAGGIANIYKNGALIQSGTTSPAAAVTRTSNFIGKSNWSNDSYYQGLIDDVRIFNTVLSLAEIQALAADVPPAIPNVTEIWVDNDYSPLGGNDGHTWALDAFDNIQDAIDAADYGDTVHVNAGIYYVDRQEVELKNGVKLIGQSAESTIIDGTPNIAYFPYSVFRSENCDSSTLLQGLTIRNAGLEAGSWGSRDGGAMYNLLSSVKIVNCIFENNLADNGGAIYNNHSSVEIINCVFENNQAGEEYQIGYGGAIYNESPYAPQQMKIENCTFNNNSCQNEGGAISYLPEEGIITGCIFIGNSAGSGGALSNVAGSISNCTFRENQADAYNGEGGAIYSLGGYTAEISGCRFIDNSASEKGGAISEVGGRISNCMFEENTAKKGGGMYTGFALSIDSCTFAHNTALQIGGGLYFWGNLETIITNSVVWGNTAVIEGDQIYTLNQGVDELYPAFQYDDIQGCGGSGPGWDSVLGVDGGGNIDENPNFADPNTMNYHLRLGSPCIDAGDNSVVTESKDLDGRIRIFDGDCDSMAIVDMGAYEFRPMDSGDFAGGCDVNLLDFNVLAASWQSNNPSIDIAPFIEPDGVIDIQELAVLVENWLR